MRLRDLGQFAAHMQFQLVPFLKREQGRAATVLNPVKALKKLHDDFEWPHPTSSASVSKRLIKEFPRSLSMQEQGSASVDPIDQLNRHEFMIRFSLLAFINYEFQPMHENLMSIKFDN